VGRRRGSKSTSLSVTQWRHRRSDSCKQQGLAVVPLDAPNSDPCWRGGPSRSFARYHRQLLIPGSPALCFLLTATNRCRSPAPPRTDSQTAMPLVTLSPQLTPQHALPISGPSQSRAEMACGHVFCHSSRRFALVRPHPGPHLALAPSLPLQSLCRPRRPTGVPPLDGIQSSCAFAHVLYSMSCPPSVPAYWMSLKVLCCC
jgi:hypothetical protein